MPSGKSKNAAAFNGGNPRTGNDRNDCNLLREGGKLFFTVWVTATTVVANRRPVTRCTGGRSAVNTPSSVTIKYNNNIFVIKCRTRRRVPHRGVCRCVLYREARARSHDRLIEVITALRLYYRNNFNNPFYNIDLIMCRSPSSGLPIIGLHAHGRLK